MIIKYCNGLSQQLEEHQKVKEILQALIELPEDAVILFWDENHLENFTSLPLHTLDKGELDEHHPILQIFVSDTLVYAGQPLEN